MKPEEQRIAIAEACGWVINWPEKWTERSVKHPNLPLPCRPSDPRVGLEILIPDYLNDLNAMHEAEETLTREQCREYNQFLCDVKIMRAEVTHEAQKWTWGSTAAQRAEAFLRAIGKWEE